MATEAANAEKQARAQSQIDAQVDRIARALGFAPPPRTRGDSRDARNANEAERMTNFLKLVADHVDPSNAGKFAAGEVVGGIQDGYVHTDAEARKSAERQREDGVAPDGAEQIDRDLRGEPVQAQQQTPTDARGNAGAKAEKPQDKPRAAESKAAEQGRGGK